MGTHSAHAERDSVVKRGGCCARLFIAAENLQRCAGGPASHSLQRCTADGYALDHCSRQRAGCQLCRCSVVNFRDERKRQFLAAPFWAAVKVRLPRCTACSRIFELQMVETRRAHTKK